MSETVNQNSAWLNQRGAWLTHFVVYTLTLSLCSLIPRISRETVWTMVIHTLTKTNVVFNAVAFIMMHGISGTPFIDTDDWKGSTLWEQIDDGTQFTPTRKYLVSLPIFIGSLMYSVFANKYVVKRVSTDNRFLISTHYCHYTTSQFALNLLVLLVNLVAKMPLMHNVRLFGIGERPMQD